jgi:hypothetical protein
MTLATFVRHARRPVYALRRIGYKLYEVTHPDEPWIAQGAVRFCAAQLKPSIRGFEWGSGRSTAWFAARLGHLTSVEHDEQWYGIVQNRLRAREIHNVTYRLIPLSHPADEPTVPVYSPLPPYIAAVNAEEDGVLGFVLVPKIAPGGLLLVDNTNWMPLSEWGVPEAWPIVHQSRNVMTETTIWRRPR